MSQTPRMLVTASAEAGVDHQLLFTTAAPHLARNVKYMNGRDAVDVWRGSLRINTGLVRPSTLPSVCALLLKCWEGEVLLH